MEMVNQVLEKIKKSLNQSDDLVVREITNNENKIFVVFINGIVDGQAITIGVMKPLTEFAKNCNSFDVNSVKQEIVTSGKCEVVYECADILNTLLVGNTLVFVNNEASAIKVDTVNLEHRAIVEPPTNAVIFGPREGFVESLKTNVSLIRKRLVTECLNIDELNIGKYTKTKVVVMYLKDIADDKVVNRIKKHLKKIDIDGIIDSQYLSDFLEEKPNSIFKQVGKSEKPDIITAKLLEGRVAIVVDGSPIVLTLPFIFLEDLQNSNDYYQKSFKITLVRILRLFGIVVATLIPGLYVAMQLNHYKILPIKFIITLMNSTQDLPFTPFMETFFIVIIFELLYEAGLRMPKTIGIVLSLIGTLIVGDTAVKAGFISPPAVLAVALSGICFYMVPDQSEQLSFIRFLFTIVGGTLAIIGIFIGLVFFFIYLVEFESYGTPYIAPYAPYIKNDMKDALTKYNIKDQISRPESFPNKNKTRLVLGGKDDGTDN